MEAGSLRFIIVLGIVAVTYILTSVLMVLHRKKNFLDWSLTLRELIVAAFVSLVLVNKIDNQGALIPFGIWIALASVCATTFAATVIEHVRGRYIE